MAKHAFSHDTQRRAGSLRRRIKHSSHMVNNNEATSVTKYNAMLAILYLSASPRGAMATMTGSPALRQLYHTIGGQPPRTEKHDGQNTNVALKRSLWPK